MQNAQPLQVNDTAEATLIVEDADTAKALSESVEDDFPEVFATSRMIALMELAASRVMKKILTPEQLSVGVGVYVKHLAATPKGVEARAVATFLGMEGKLYKFRVEAYDKGGLIGEGEHTRAVIETARIMAGAKKRMGE